MSEPGELWGHDSANDLTMYKVDPEKVKKFLSKNDRRCGCNYQCSCN